MAGEKYNSQNTAHSSRVLTILTAAAASLTPATYYAETISFSRPSNVIERPDTIGGPNGFAIVDKQPTGSARIQVPGKTLASYNQIKTGMNFSDDFGYGSEKWVIHSINQTFNMGTYWVIDVSLVLDVAGTGSGTAFT